VADVPASVQAQVQAVTGTETTSYDKARALSDYFTNGVNGFLYTTSTKLGDSGNDLVDFLKFKQGFCQQYAAAMAVMLRVASIPSRVVLGYTHPAPDGDGRFTVTTRDAHAWVEAYFGSLGWIPFDPTPLTAARATTLDWAPQNNAGVAASGGNPSAGANSGAPSNARPTIERDQSGPAAAAHRSARSSWPFWVGGGAVLLVLAVVLLPLLIRSARRRRRVHAVTARHGGPDALWAELADTAVDLGYVWSPVRSPRQVVDWLERDGVVDGAGGSLHSLATAVETARYAGPGARTPSMPAPDELVHNLRDVSSSLRAGRSRRERLRARLMPASLNWVVTRRQRAGGRH
jgi:Transglutaminase-like superfamily